jgi:hypothetical protein
MKNKAIFLSILTFIICLAPFTTLYAQEISAKGVAKLKHSGNGTMSNSPVILKINGEYNKYGGKLSWAYNGFINCGFNVEIPAGHTVLEVVYKGTPTVKLEFNAMEDMIYTIDHDDIDKACVRVYKKDKKGKIPVSDCGNIISYSPNELIDTSKYAILSYDNKFRDCINILLLKIDDTWGNKKMGMAWGYYYYPENYDIKIEPGKHKLEIIGGDDRIPRTFEFEFEAGKSYILDIINEIGSIFSGCTGNLVIIETP